MAARAEAELAIPASRRRGGDPAPESAVKLASQDRGLEGAERVDGDAAQEGGAAGAATLGAAAGAAAPKSAAESVGVRAPESVANLASQDLVPGGAERADGVAAQEGRAAGAAMLGAAAGAVAPGPAAEPAGDRAPESDADLAGGAARDGVAAQVNERADGVAAQEGSVAWQQAVATKVRGLSTSYFAGKATETGELLPDFDDVSSGDLVLSAEKRAVMGEGVQSSGRTALLLSAEKRALMVGAWMARGRCVEGVARGARGGAWKARRGGRNRRGERDGRGGGGALARHA